MKQITCYCLFILLLVSCKKESEFAINQNDTSFQIKSFFQKKISKSNSINRELYSITLQNIEFDRSVVQKFNDKLDIIYVPIKDIEIKELSEIKSKKISIKSNSLTAKNTSTELSAIVEFKAAVFYSYKGEIIEGNLVKISSSTLSKMEIETNFPKIIKNKYEGFSGKITINTLHQKYNSEFDYRGNKVIKSAAIFPAQPFSSSNSLSNIKRDACLAWYLVTKYYIDGVYVGQDEGIFLGTTGCGTENQGEPGENQNLPEPEEAGTGNATINSDSLCAQAARLLSDNNLNSVIRSFKDSLGLNYEVGYAMTSNGTQYNNYYPQTGKNAPNGLMPVNLQVYPQKQKIDALIHTHPTGLLNTLSAGDIKAIWDLFITGHINNISTFSLFVVTPYGPPQLVRITDPLLFSMFGNAYLTNSAFPSFLATTTSNLSYSQSYSANTWNLLNMFHGSGITLYEAEQSNYVDPNAISDWSKVQNGISYLSIMKVKCGN